MVTRRSIRLSLCAVIALLSALPIVGAGAAKPTKEAYPFESFVFDAGIVCTFPVAVDVLAAKEKVLTFTDQEGNVTKQIITGTLKVALRNTETGDAVSVNISGPVITEYNADGWVTEVFLGRSVPLPSEMVFLLTSGRTVTTISPDGVVEIIDQHGQVIDLCAELS